MEATSLPQKGGSLLAHVLSRLRPEVFTHPIWVHFGDREKPVSPEGIETLRGAAKQLQQDDLDCACQVLLICAVCQNYAGQRDQALSTIQQILSIAKPAGLIQEILWATWGACAICVQKGDYEQAARNLQSLYILLREQNDWILADYVEMVEQCLAQKALASPVGGSNPPLDQSLVGLMRFTFEWFQQWGFLDQSTITQYQSMSSISICRGNQKAKSSYFLLDAQLWQKYWHIFRQVARGELRLKWVARSPAPQAEASPALSPQFFDQGHSCTKPVAAPSPPAKSFSRASLLVYCLGSFRVYINDEAIESWPGHKCMQILKYLVVHRSTPVNQEVLMELFWPGMDSKGARRNLYQAIYNLRQALQTIGEEYPFVLTEGNTYRLNPELDLWVDSEAFILCYQNAQHLARSGRGEEATREFQMAEELYQGEFLAEDRYEDWPLVHRENLKNAYLDALDQLSQHFYTNEQLSMCIYYCHKILQEDNCREDVHRRVMMCYMNMDQPHLALRQYHICVDALRRELDVLPMPATEELYKQIQHNRGK